MSVVTNILIVGLGAGEHLEEINEWITENYYDGSRGSGFKKIDNFAGGNKAIETTILAAAFTMFSVKEKFTAFLKTIKWEFKTQLFIQEDNEDHFSVVTVSSDDHD